MRRSLLYVPAPLAAALVAGLYVALAMDDPWRAEAAALDRAVLYFDAKDYQAARVGLERGARSDLTVVAQNARFQLALCLDALGEKDRASRLLDQLAPPDHVGYGPAHIQQALRLWPGARSPSVRATMESQLKRGYEADPKSSKANALLGEFYVATGRSEMAEPYLERADADRPDLLLVLAGLVKARGLDARARGLAEQAERAFRKRVEADPRDHNARLLWAEALVRLKSFQAATVVLRQGAASGADDRYPGALANVYLVWADARSREKPADLDGRLDLLGKGLAADPSNLQLLDRFSALIRAGGDTGARALASLQGLLATGKATGAVRYALGLEAWEHGRKDEAIVLWDQAAKLDPNMPAFANNLAWAIAIGPAPDLPRALAAIEPVVARFPDDPRFRETRGQILARLGRWNDALPDLEAALLVYPDSPALHRTLADTYDHLDSPGMAAAHRRRAGGPPDARPQ